MTKNEAALLYTEAEAIIDTLENEEPPRAERLRLAHKLRAIADTLLAHEAEAAAATVYECTDCGCEMTANVSRCDECIEAEDEQDRISEMIRLNGEDFDYQNYL